MKEVNTEIRSINANIEVVREGIPEILERTNVIQNAALKISYTLGSQLENLQTCQQNYLPKLKNSMETLPEMIENRVMLRLDDYINEIVEIVQAPQLAYNQRSAVIQKYVS